MHTPSYILAAALALAATSPAAAHPPLAKQAWLASRQPAVPLTARLTVQPGQTIRWQSPRLPGAVTRVSLVADGLPMAYELKPATNSCIGYAYGAGVALRLTDCVKGKRVRVLRVRAVNAGLAPAQLLLRFWA